MIGFAMITLHRDCNPPMSFEPMPMMFCTPLTIFGAQVMIVPMDEITLPTTTSRGPSAAASIPIFTMVCCCAGVRALNLSTSPCTNSATF